MEKRKRGRLVVGRDEEGKVRWGEEEGGQTTPLPVAQTSRQTISGDPRWGENSALSFKDSQTLARIYARVAGERKRVAQTSRQTVSGDSQWGEN